jgi:hypothetical protein
MTDKERQVLEGQLAEIDRHRAELEIVLSTIPPNRYDRQELEAELRGLWSLRLELAERLNPRPMPPSRSLGFASGEAVNVAFADDLGGGNG